MGNEQSDVRNKWLTCVPKTLKEFSQMEFSKTSSAYSMESDSDSDCDDITSEQSQLLENAIINNDTEKLLQIMHNTDPNLSLNEKQENALILAVKLSRLEVVNILLSCGLCNKNFVNIHSCSALDVALITAFDNRLQPRHSICWEIVALLLDHRAEPACKDAMMYVIRTAFKHEHSTFIHDLIRTLVDHATSYKIHELLLEKLHRHQPMLTTSIDPFLEHVSSFSTKLIKSQNGHFLSHVISAFVYYIESHWQRKEVKVLVFTKLVVYATAAGWHWSAEEMLHMTRVCEKLARCCQRWICQPPTLCHLSKVTVRNTTPHPMAYTLKQLVLPEAVKDYLMLKDIDSFFANNDLCIESLVF